MDLEKLKSFLLKNPEYEEYLKRILDYEKEKNITEEEYPWGWEYHQVKISHQKLRKLCEEGIIKITYSSSRKPNRYILTDRSLVEKYFKMKEEGKIDNNIHTYTPDEETLNNIFKEIDEEIIGNEITKKIIKKFLSKNKKIHILLYGPPASGKSLIGEIIAKHLPEPYCVYITATDLSAAGLFNVLYQYRPKILIIDEIDKIKNKKDLDTLHNLMWEGRIRRTKGDYITEWIEINTKVLGIANDLSRMRESILSRFLIIEMEEPSKEEFIEICVKSIKKENPNFDGELANYIAEKVYEKCKDVRKAVMIANLEPEDKKEVDEYIKKIK